PTGLLRCARNDGCDRSLPPKEELPDRQPRSVEIGPGREPPYRERARPEAGAQLPLKRPGRARLDLVLDGDVRPPRRAVLGNEQAVEGRGELLAHRLERLAVDPKRGPLPQVD